MSDMNPGVAEQPKFEPMFADERKTSRDYSGTPEWDASKTPPSRFQKRKGSVYATPSSRDGHVERNRDAVEGFHKAHEKRWSNASISTTASSPTLQGLAEGSSPPWQQQWQWQSSQQQQGQQAQQQQRRKSSRGSKGEASS